MSDNNKNMKTNLESMVKQTFEGNKFLASEFHDAGDMVYDIFDQETCPVDELIGKKIVKARVVHFSEGDVGLALSFKDYSNPLFFHAGCDITVED